MVPRPPIASLFPYTTLFRSPRSVWYGAHFKTKNSQVSQFLGEIYQNAGDRVDSFVKSGAASQLTNDLKLADAVLGGRSEEHTSELQSRRDLVCRLLLEKENE